MPQKKKEKKWNVCKRLSKKEWRDKDERKKLRETVRLVVEKVSKIGVVKEKDLGHLVKVSINLCKVLTEHQLPSNLISSWTLNQSSNISLRSKKTILPLILMIQAN
jgi:hypothetical protein